MTLSVDPATIELIKYLSGGAITLFIFWLLFGKPIVVYRSSDENKEILNDIADSLSSIDENIAEINDKLEEK